jgi:hypothetical protein
MTGPEGSAPPPADPWKSFRGVTAGILILEAIAVLLALPVVSAVGAGGLTVGPLVYLIALATALVLLTGIQSRPWAIWMDLGLQPVLIAGYLIYPGVGLLGVVFTVVWALIAYFRVEVLRRQ